MTKIAVVTSCSAKGWQEYGQRFVETYKQFWPSDIPLYLVSEDQLPKQPAGVTLLQLCLSQPATAFMARHEHRPRAHGREMQEGDQGWKPKKIAAGYNFRYDAFRFAKKVFAIDLVARTYAPRGSLFWIDADVVTFAPVGRDLLERMLPASSALSCLDRGQYHSECGFVGYNLELAAAKGFIASFAELYASDYVFELQEWHDSWVFDWLRRRMKVPTFAIPHRSRSCPLPNSELGRALDHLKGSRKTYGRTPFEQLVINKDVRHYRGLA